MPWYYVLADAAVSGTLACRTGYTLAKTIIERRDEFGVTWFLIDDLSRMSRNTIESLQHGKLAEATGVRVVGASDGYDSANPQSSPLLPVLGSMNEAFITQPRSKVKRGSAIDVARLFNEHKVGGKQTWSDSRVRQHYGRGKLYGKDVLHKTKQVVDRQTGKKKVVQLPESEWIWRDVPHLQILSDELAQAVHRKLSLGAESFGRKAKDRWKTAHRVDLYPKVLIRPVCGCYGNPMILGRSDDKYQSFFCFNANNGIHGCTNRGYKSARIIDEAVLGAVMATLFTDDFLADLTADVNKRLAWIARQPVPSTKKPATIT